MAGLPLPRTAPAPPTGPEFQAALERRLAASLAAFDSQMKRERERLEQAKTEKRAADFGRPDENLDLAVDGADSEGPSYGDETPTAASGNVPETESEQSGDTASEPPDVAAGAAPESIPDGQDDDIVARQIREAAQEETDPGLREKLWEEYRKYKQSG
jgi:hypothetical protein